MYHYLVTPGPYWLFDSIGHSIYHADYILKNTNHWDMKKRRWKIKRQVRLLIQSQSHLQKSYTYRIPFWRLLFRITFLLLNFEFSVWVLIWNNLVQSSSLTKILRSISLGVARSVSPSAERVPGVPWSLDWTVKPRLSTRPYSHSQIISIFR